ncbi:MAG TPA: rod shape-determining protein MreC [Fermentimonas sp.]|nr:rod shape-determining protein MreC [Fermentimonas sp.]
MRNLLNFIIRNSHWMLAILLIAFSFYLVFAHNSYQRSVYLTSANSVMGWIYNASNNVTSFVHLKKSNQLLLEQNATLESELYLLRSQINDLDTAGTSSVVAFANDSIAPSQFSFIPAEVVNISFSGANNFITINRGSIDGIKPDMGVISQRGVVGVVSNVSTNFSLIIPVINPLFRLSAKLKNSDNYGSLSWNGKNFNEAQLGELPKHEIYNNGDTIVTSFSRIFPKQLIIGFVSGVGTSKDDNFNTFEVELATDFNSLQNVLVISDKYYEEQKALEEAAAR